MAGGAWGWGRVAQLSHREGAHGPESQSWFDHELSGVSCELLHLSGPRCLWWKAGIIVVPTERCGKEQIRKCRCNPVSWGLPAPLRSPQDQCEAPCRGPETLPRISADASGWSLSSGPCLCCHLSPPHSAVTPACHLSLPLLPSKLSPTAGGVEVVRGGQKGKELPLNRPKALRSLRCWETFTCTSPAGFQSPRPQPLTGLVPPALSALPSAFPPTVPSPEPPPSVRGLLGFPTSCLSPSRCFSEHPSQPGAPEQNHLHLMEPPS